jgi:acetyl esterase
LPIDPCFADLLADPRNAVRPPPAAVPMDKVRRAADGAMALPDAPEMARIDERSVRLPDREIVVRHYRPTNAEVLPLILFAHGGGWVWGSLDTHDPLCRELADRTGAAVISVAYRLAPEHHYPAAPDDVWAVLADIMARPEAYGVHPGRVALAGDSAGGQIVTETMVRALEAGHRPKHLALFYPALDPACDTASHAEFAEGAMLTHEGMRWFWDCYLGADRSIELRGIDDATAASFPPVTLQTAGCDVLRDEGQGFADRLRSLGVDVESRDHAGMLHGFLSLGVETPAIEATLALAAERLRDSLSAS